jgi:hypothetical protein
MGRMLIVGVHLPRHAPHHRPQCRLPTLAAQAVGLGHGVRSR